MEKPSYLIAGFSIEKPKGEGHRNVKAPETETRSAKFFVILKVLATSTTVDVGVLELTRSLSLIAR
jgi:hypothetical protein